MKITIHFQVEKTDSFEWPLSAQCATRNIRGELNQSQSVSEAVALDER